MEDTPRHTFKKLIPRYVFIGIFALLLLRTGGANAAALTQKQAMGSDVPSHKLRVAYTLSATAAVSSNDVWTVGSQKVGEQNAQPMIQHWDGSQWSIVPSPDPGEYGDLSAIAAISANNIWAVGLWIQFYPEQTLIEHWDGTRWSVIPSPAPGLDGSMLVGIAAVSANNIWAVGSYSNPNPPTTSTLIEHWDGTQWSIVSSPNPSNGSALYGVAAASATDVWAVGQYTNSNKLAVTLTEHWDGTQWSIVPSPNGQGNDSSLVAVTTVSGNDVWAVGGNLIEHWDGTQWSIVPGSDPYANLSGVTAISTNNVWAVGRNLNGLSTEHWNGKQWKSVKNPKIKNASLNGVAAISSNDIWAVGSRDFKTKQENGVETLTEHWNGTKWSVIASPPV